MVFPLSRNSTVLIIVIAAIAAILSVVSYEHSMHNANEILKIASDDVRSNADIQAHDLSMIVEQELNKVTAILKTLAQRLLFIITKLSVVWTSLI